jgi:hypothetical protein
MKKFLLIAAIAGTLVACNNDSASTEAKADSVENTADSLQERVEDKADSTVDVIENKADSTINVIEKADSTKN